MTEWFKDFSLAFIPLFVAVDPIGLTYLFLGLTEDINSSSRQKIINQATLTAAIVAIGFMFLGQFIFKALGITITDFQIAGGLILLVLASWDLLAEQSHKGSLQEGFGVVPLGVPLIAGPATLTTLLALMGPIGITPTLVALLTNLFLVNFCFHQSHWLIKIFGKTGLRAASKIITLLLVAIAVNMIRRGLQGV